ncbi:MAG: carboxylating nicotinate-nucleotide diphosphorylase [Candidatus Obscuribacterales bacterium]|nr:carboxylating nicotinate-nucleotide diphosphorylase [Candidatus Obscuribacterales bacterium]
MTEAQFTKQLIDSLIALGLIEDLGGLPEQACHLESFLSPEKLSELIALDITTAATIAADAKVQAKLLLKESAVLSGLEFCKRVFSCLDKDIEVEILRQDGTYIDVDRGEKIEIALIKGSARAILIAERLSLNLVQRMCGIATNTRKYAQIAAPFGIKILDTRKTIPGLRAIEKMAVLAGGGTNHRMGLYDAVLVKDNHIRAAGSITKAVENVRTYLKQQPEAAARLKKDIEVEVASLVELHEALDAGVNAVLLDNMSPDQVRQAIQTISNLKKSCFVEVSGGVNLSNLETYLIDGVDAISIGALTHSAVNIDLSLEF